MGLYLVILKKGGIMDKTINTTERELLLMLLQKEESSLQIQINHTSHRDYKLMLKERLGKVVALIEKMQVAEPIAL
jgi:hypothetical protein